MISPEIGRRRRSVPADTIEVRGKRPSTDGAHDFLRRNQSSLAMRSRMSWGLSTEIA